MRYPDSARELSRGFRLPAVHYEGGLLPFEPSWDDPGAPEPDRVEA